MQDITKSRKFLLRYYELFTSHLSNSSERFLYLSIKKPISKYCIVATVCHILFFIFLEFTCIYCIYAIITNFLLSKLDHGVAPLGCLPAGGDTISCHMKHKKIALIFRCKISSKYSCKYIVYMYN